jgi:hypothetical protein
LGQTTDTSMQIDFGSLPGSKGSSALLRVWSSDGANVGGAVSSPFKVPSNLPSGPDIASPRDQSAFGPDDIVEFLGGALAGDGEILPDGEIQWSSSLQGPLGRGETLYTAMSAGFHTITMTATDGEGNRVSQEIHLSVASGPPRIAIQTSVVNGCPAATIQANPDPYAGLTSVSYTLDGGATFQTIAPAQLPYRFPVSGQGQVDIMANVTDLAGQVATATATVNVAAPCGN